MKYLTIDQIKKQLRLDFDCEDDLLELYGGGAEEAVLYLCNRTYENLVGTYGCVPDAIRQVTLEIVTLSYDQRSPAGRDNLSAVPYNFDLLVKEFIALTGTPLMNERNRLLGCLQEANTNIAFFAADDESETKTELMERISSMYAKYLAVSEPTPMILEYMRQQTTALQADVKAYLETINES